MDQARRISVGRVSLVGISFLLLIQSGVSFGAQQRVAPGGAPPPGGGPIQLEGHVRVVQGDILDGRIPQGRIGIGVIGVQAPRGNSPCGREAIAFVQDLVEDGASLEDEPGLFSDARKVRLYHVFTSDGRSVAEELVSAGLARANGQGSNRERLAELEADARAARRGCVWQ